MEFWLRPVPWPVMIRVVCGGIDAGGDFLGAAQDQAGHRRMDADRQAIMQGFAADDGGRAGELEFARDDVLGEIAFADEIRHDVDLVGIDHVERLAHRGFLFPEAAMHLGEQAAAADFIGVVEVGRGGVRILGGPVTDDEKGAVRLRRDGHGGKVAGLPRNARTGERFQFPRIAGFRMRLAADGGASEIAVVDRSGEAVGTGGDGGG